MNVNVPGYNAYVGKHDWAHYNTAVCCLVSMGSLFDSADNFILLQLTLTVTASHWACCES